MNGISKKEEITAFIKKEFAKQEECHCLALQPLIHQLEQVFSLPREEVGKILLSMDGEEFIIEGQDLFPIEDDPC